MQAGAHRADRNRERLGDLGVGQTLPRHEDEQISILCVEFGDRVEDAGDAAVGVESFVDTGPRIEGLSPASAPPDLRSAASRRRSVRQWRRRRFVAMPNNQPRADPRSVS